MYLLLVICASANNRQRRHYVLWSSVRRTSVVRQLTLRSRDVIPLYLVEGFHETCRKHSSCEWALLKRFPGSEVKVKVVTGPVNL